MNVPQLDISPGAALVGLAAGAAALYMLANQRPGESIGATIGREVVAMAEGAGVGAIVGIGEAIGIPATSRTQCQIDLANGDAWAASFSCTAGEYASAVGSSVGAAAATGAGVVDDVISAPVYGIGDAVGIPRTSGEQCQIDLARGDWWAASSSCTAGVFLAARLKNLI